MNRRTSIGIVLVLGALAVVVAGVFRPSAYPAEPGETRALGAEEKSIVLPLGTGRYSLDGPEQGKVYFCQSLKQAFKLAGGALGAYRSGPWIDEANNVWYPLARAVVDGATNWPSAYARFTAVGEMRQIEVNNVPTNHSTGNFPVDRNDDAYAYDRNPNKVKETAVTLEIPKQPTIAAQPTCVALAPIGYVLNGVSLFSAVDGQGRDPAWEVSDACHGHPSPNSLYHYHILADNDCLGTGAAQNPKQETKLIGYAFDGFGIYSQYENGQELFSADLDECHGHEGNVLWEGEVADIYHYHITHDYPYTIGCYKGTPIDSVANRAAWRRINTPPPGV